MAGFVDIYHPDLDVTSTVTAKSLPAWQRVGWQPAIDDVAVGAPVADPGVPAVPVGDEPAPNPEEPS